MSQVGNKYRVEDMDKLREESERVGQDLQKQLKKLCGFIKNQEKQKEAMGLLKESEEINKSLQSNISKLCQFSKERRKMNLQKKSANQAVLAMQLHEEQLPASEDKSGKVSAQIQSSKKQSEDPQSSSMYKNSQPFRPEVQDEDADKIQQEYDQSSEKPFSKKKYVKKRVHTQKHAQLLKDIKQSQNVIHLGKDVDQHGQFQEVLEVIHDYQYQFHSWMLQQNELKIPICPMKSIRKIKVNGAFQIEVKWQRGIDKYADNSQMPQQRIEGDEKIIKNLRLNKQTDLYMQQYQQALNRMKGLTLFHLDLTFRNTVKVISQDKKFERFLLIDLEFAFYLGKQGEHPGQQKLCKAFDHLINTLKKYRNATRSWHKLLLPQCEPYTDERRDECRQRWMEREESGFNGDYFRQQLAEEMEFYYAENLKHIDSRLKGQ